MLACVALGFVVEPLSLPAAEWMDIVPEALWAQILSHIDLSQEKIRLQLVCRAWTSVLTTPLAYNSSPLIIDREPWGGGLLSRGILQALPSLHICFHDEARYDERDLEPLTYELRNLRELKIESEQTLSTQQCEMLASITYLAVCLYTSKDQEVLVDQLGRLAAAGCSLKRLDLDISGFNFRSFDIHEFLSCDLHLLSIVDCTVFIAISKSIAMRLVTFEADRVRVDQWEEEEEVDRYLPDLSSCTRLVRVKLAGPGVPAWPHLQPALQQAIRQRLPSSHTLIKSDHGIEFRISSHL